MTVYVKFYTQYGVTSEVVSDSIVFRTVVLEENIENIEDIGILDIDDTDDTGDIDDIGDIGILDIDDTDDIEDIDNIEDVEDVDEPGIVDEIIDIITPEPEPEPEIRTEDLVAKETPISMKGEWNLLPREQINEFVLAPLPKGLERLAQKFPELQETFEKVGINKITDIEKLRNAELSLSGLSKSAIFSESELALLKSVPLSELSNEIKSKIPSEIIFAKIGNKKSVDFNIGLNISDQGEVRQKIAAISGQKLFLTVRPESAARSVYGYLAFKNAKDIGILNIEDIKNKLSVGPIVPQGCGTQTQTVCKQAPQPRFAAAQLRTMEPTMLGIKNLVNSFVFARPAFAQDYGDIEEKFITQKFSYADEDNDGLWTAEIYAPIVEGEYEIITVIEYEDPELGTRMIKLTTVVDPEGYVYERIKNQELRIKDATVSIYRLNSGSGEYELWQADDYSQKNPQTTDATGRYSFLVPEGTYYLAVEAPGYPPYQSEPFAVREGAGVHQNIELKAKNAWLKMFDWKVAAIFLLFILVVWNFWRDRKRIMN